MSRTAALSQSSAYRYDPKDASTATSVPWVIASNAAVRATASEREPVNTV